MTRRIQTLHLSYCRLQKHYQNLLAKHRELLALRHHDDMLTVIHRKCCKPTGPVLRIEADTGQRQLSGGHQKGNGGSVDPQRQH